MKKIVSLVLSLCFAVSVLSVPSFAAGSLIPASGSKLDALTGLTYGALSQSFIRGSIAGSALFNGGVNFFNAMSPGANIRGELNNTTNNNTYNYNNTGVTNNYVFNEYINNNTTNNYTAINTLNNNFYNLVTNEYNTYNSISFNPEYNTYYLYSPDYSTYISNNQTYLSYYFINNSTNDTYYYEVYYELPDGRSSYNLTAEDVWGKYFIYDVINYVSVSEDDGTLALLHFDGSLNDDSFYQGQYVMCDVPSSFVDGIWSSCLRMDGGSFKGIRFDPDVMSDPYTLEFRFRVSNTSPIDIPNAYSGNVYFSSSGSSKYFLNGRGDPTGKFYFYNLPDLSSNIWYSAAITFDGSNYNLFVDGRSLGNKSLLSIFSDNSLNNNVSYDFLVSPSDPIPNDLVYSGVTYIHYDKNLTLSPGSNSRKIDSTVYLDEVRLSRGVLYSSSYTPSVHPFDTNKVLVVPSDAPSKPSTIAIQSDFKASGLRVGGVRPSYPDNGFVYVSVQDGIVLDVEQYIDNGWYSVNAAYYSNDRWNNFVGFNVNSTLTGSLPFGSDGSGTSGSDSSGSGVLSGLSGLLSSLILAVLGFFTSLFAWFSGFIALFGSLVPFIPSSIFNVLVSSVSFILLIVILKFIRG